MANENARERLRQLEEALKETEEELEHQKVEIVKARKGEMGSSTASVIDDLLKQKTQEKITTTRQIQKLRSSRAGRFGG
jgi:uncharacterized protein (DUF342 family)